MKKKKVGIIKRINRWGRRHKALLLVIFLLYLAVLGTSVYYLPSVQSALPREIFVGENSACYVKNEAAANMVLEEIPNYFLTDGAKLMEFETDPVISVSIANPFKAHSHTISETEAARMIADSLDDSDTSKVTVKYMMTEAIAFTPKPTYKKDESMLAGEKRVERESADGSKDVTSVITAVNGEQTDKKTYKGTTTKKGTSAVIYKGTLGLPTGESWEEYEGDPVYNNADDLVATAYNYIGAPYKHGGVSLKTGVSCVGYVRAIYLKYGIKIGNSHRSMETAGIGVSYSNARKGDIICYKGHVGLYIGNGKMLDATSSRGVGVNTVKPGKIIAVRRIVQ